MDIIQLWEKARELVRQEMHDAFYNTFIKNLVPHSLQEDQLTLLADAPFTRTWLSGDAKNIRIIENALQEVTGREMHIVISSADEVQQAEAAQKAAPVVDSSIRLNPKYTFDTFVVGTNNQLAHAAALAVAESPAQSTNPLFIYGGVGLGKTHLMHAIGHYVRERHPEMQLLYITSEEFTNELISAIQHNKTEEFRNRFRKVDVLMVDDIQFIAGRDSTQEEFFHTFNALHSANKQIILASDRPPRDIARLEERLRSRFDWGLTADITRPDLETRIAILRKKATSEYIAVGDDVLEMIALRINRNIRELEGCLTRLVAYANLMKKPITTDVCEEALRDVFAKEAPKVITADMIIRAVAEYYTLTPDDLTGKSRRHEITVPRQIAMYLTREMTGLSLPQIGDAFGGRDHTTVLYSCNTVAKNVKNSVSTANLVEDIRRLIREAK
ncbi:MAG: chromosomal replication initiator protein DnaA [Clostridia bacterium]|nr:chromosomal replication initiator protein DnaA [Clostridia bacterium]